MKPRSSPPLTYFPAYAGLFASLILAEACNAFLDIQYRGFGFEVLLWAVIFALTLRLGWRQRGQVSDAGKRGQKVVLVIGLIASILVFIPMWGFPRAGVAILAALQSAQNCVTVSRRQLHLGLLVSLVMVLFATSHFRADWTMLFYLVPYIAAVVFTLVAEQINRRAQDVRRESQGVGSSSGQWAAIAAATVAILMAGALLYTVTPQVTWPYLFWKYGQPGSLGKLSNTPGAGQTGQGQSGSAADGQQPGSDPGSQGMGEGSGWEQAEGYEPLPGHGGLSLKDMREAARRPGMPKWQSSAIERLANLAEVADLALTPIRLGLDEFWSDIKEWLKTHRQDIAQSLIVLIILALLVATWRLLKEARPGIWLFAHLDYLRLGLLKQHSPGSPGAIQYYKALQRLLDLQGVGRPPGANSREYMAQVCRQYRHLRREVVELTLIFEQARYGSRAATPAELTRMRELYRRIFRNVDSLASTGG